MSWRGRGRRGPALRCRRLCGHRPWHRRRWWADALPRVRLPRRPLPGELGIDRPGGPRSVRRLGAETQSAGFVAGAARTTSAPLASYRPRSVWPVSTTVIAQVPSRPDAGREAGNALAAQWRVPSGPDRLVGAVAEPAPLVAAGAGYPAVDAVVRLRLARLDTVDNDTVGSVSDRDQHGRLGSGVAFAGVAVTAAAGTHLASREIRYAASRTGEAGPASTRDRPEHQGPPG